MQSLLSQFQRQAAIYSDCTFIKMPAKWSHTKCSAAQILIISVVAAPNWRLALSAPQQIHLDPAWTEQMCALFEVTWMSHACEYSAL